MQQREFRTREAAALDRARIGVQMLCLDHREHECVSANGVQNHSEDRLKQYLPIGSAELMAQLFWNRLVP